LILELDALGDELLEDEEVPAYLEDEPAQPQTETLDDAVPDTEQPNKMPLHE
jgi:hypothetical protein